MTRRDAAIGSAAFFLLAPGVVAGLIPFLITRWRIQDGASQTLTIIGGVLLILFLAMLIECFVRFVRHGAGTPAPLAPTEKLVVSGLYRHTRNPMYVAVLGLILAQMLLFGHAALLPYAITVWCAFQVFVVYFEEKRLRAEFPEEYAAYFDNVPRWIPRLTPWSPAKEG